MNFATTLKNLREEKKLTQAALAKELKVSRPTIAGYETRNRQPDFERLQRISQYFDVSIDYLIFGEENYYLSCSPNQNSAAYNERIFKAICLLSPESKKDIISYIELLQLRDRYKKKK
ncbi:MAG: helix-turn-helix transcriptional regulator [Lachnospiraceae bacterium]